VKARIRELLLQMTVSGLFGGAFGRVLSLPVPSSDSFTIKDARLYDTAA